MPEKKLREFSFGGNQFHPLNQCPKKINRGT